jgi:membrane-associated phospholipid phosphatase
MNKKLLRAISFFVVGIVFLFIFYGFSIQVKRERFKQVNFNFTVRLQHNIPDRFAEIFEDTSFVISPSFSLLWLGFITLFSTFDLKSKKLYFGALFIPLFFGLMIGGEILGKSRVESPAPPFFMLKNPVTIFPTYHVQELYSYPSGHAARALFFAGFIGYLLTRQKNKFLFTFWAGILVMAVVFISLGKIYLGHHWLTDIIGGWILASAALSFSYALLLFNCTFNKITQSVLISKKIFLPENS